MSTTILARQLAARIRHELPSLTAEQTEDLARMLETLVQTFQPEIAYVFGSQARGDATFDSDVDLLLVVTSSDEPKHRRAQAAYQATGRQSLPTDILIWTRAEFDRQRSNPATLPGTILREGRVLYAGRQTVPDSESATIQPFGNGQTQALFLNDAEEWLVRADSGLQVAMLMLQANSVLSDAAAHHAQQAGEKALRGFLTAYGIPFGKTDELEPLLDACEGIHPRFQQLTLAASTLSPYGIEFRYPGGRLEPSEAEARDAVQHATDILRFVRDTLANATPPSN